MSHIVRSERTSRLPACLISYSFIHWLTEWLPDWNLCMYTLWFLDALFLLLLQISITDVGNDFSVWSAFCESHNIPDLRVTNSDTVLCINDPRHASFGCRLLLPSNVQGIWSHWMFTVFTHCHFMCIPYVYLAMFIGWQKRHPAHKSLLLQSLEAWMFFLEGLA